MSVGSPLSSRGGAPACLPPGSPRRSLRGSNPTLRHFCRLSSKRCSSGMRSRVCFTDGRGWSRHAAATPAGRCPAHAQRAGRRHRPRPLDRRPARRRPAGQRPDRRGRRGDVVRRTPADPVRLQPVRPASCWPPTSAPPMCGSPSADLAAAVLDSEVVDLDIALGPEVVLRWVVDHGRSLLERQPDATTPTWPASASDCPDRSSTPPGVRRTRRSCPAGTASTCRAFVRAELGCARRRRQRRQRDGARRARHRVRRRRPPAVRQGGHRHRQRDHQRRRAAPRRPGRGRRPRAHPGAPRRRRRVPLRQRRLSRGGRQRGGGGRAPAGDGHRGRRPAATSWPWCAAVRSRRPELVREAGRTIGEVLASAVSLLNPSVIVIGGSLSQAGDPLLAGVREVVYRRSLPLATAQLRIVQATAGDLAGVVGAAVMVVDQRAGPRRGRPLRRRRRVTSTAGQTPGVLGVGRVEQAGRLLDPDDRRTRQHGRHRAAGHQQRRPSAP